MFHAVNPHYLRLRAAKDLSTKKEYKQEVAQLNLGEHLLQSEHIVDRPVRTSLIMHAAYQGSEKDLVGVDTRDAFAMVFGRRGNPVTQWLSSTLDQLPTVSTSYAQHRNVLILLSDSLRPLCLIWLAHVLLCDHLLRTERIAGRATVIYALIQ
jgi:hypothetical protein